MLSKLLPKEEKYFEYFNDMIKHIREMSGMTQQLFSTRLYEGELVRSMISFEKRCDEITSKVVKQLNKTFITPFDREDVFTLISRLDDISDILLAAAVRTEVFALSSPIEGADKLTSIINQQIEELEHAMNQLRTRAKVMDQLKAVKDLESEADRVYRASMQHLFTHDSDAISVMKKKEILDILETASDKCQSVANTIITIFIKNS